MMIFEWSLSFAAGNRTGVDATCVLNKRSEVSLSLSLSLSLSRVLTNNEKRLEEIEHRRKGVEVKDETLHGTHDHFLRRSCSRVHDMNRICLTLETDTPSILVDVSQQLYDNYFIRQLIHLLKKNYLATCNQSNKKFIFYSKQHKRKCLRIAR
jgi:hypothetical protein